MPTPRPGLNLVPRWRTMISPPVTVWPANTFTPRRFAFESRPLREEPSPFLCAISSSLLVGRSARRGSSGSAELDARDLDSREVLAVAVAALVAALGLELHDAQLRPALVRDDLRLDLHLREVVTVDDLVVAAVEQRHERDARALVDGQLLHEEVLALFDPVLLAAGLHDRVHGDGVSRQSSVVPAAVPALARERRRPPLRPRRRAADSTPSSPGAASSWSSASADGPLPLSTSVATAAVRPTSSIRTRRFSPTCRPPPVTDTM